MVRRIIRSTKMNTTDTLTIPRTDNPSMSEDQIRSLITKKAYELWEKSGKKPGRDKENWTQAERIVRGQLKR